MSRNSNTQKRQSGNRSNNNRSRQSDPTRSMISSVIGQYARALVSNDEQTINSMTLYSSSGSMGGGSSSNNTKALQNAGAQSIYRIQPHAGKGKKTATVLFSGNGKDIACVGVFNVLDGGHVLSDWQIFLPA